MGSSKTTTTSNQTSTTNPDARYQNLAYQNYAGLQDWARNFQQPNIPQPVGFNQDQLAAQEAIRNLGMGTGTNPFLDARANLQQFMNYSPQQVGATPIPGGGQVAATPIAGGGQVNPQSIQANPFEVPQVGSVPLMQGLPQVSFGAVTSQGYAPASADATLLDRSQFRDVTASPFDAAQLNRGDIRDVLAGSTPEQLRQFLSAFDPQYANAVIDRNLSDIDRSRQLAQQPIAAAAAQQGAFGGSRQGVAEAETNRAYGDIAARSSADLRYQGFNTALGALQQDLARQQAAQLANQGVDYNTALQNAGFRQQAGLSNSDQALRASIANQGADVAAGLSNAQMRQALAIANMQSQNQAGMFGADAANRASQINAQLGLQAGLANQDAAGRVAQSNQQAELQRLFANQGYGFQGALANQQNAYQTQGLNAQQALQAALANQQNSYQSQALNSQQALQAALANQQNASQTQGFNAQQAMQAALANQQAGLQGANLGLNAAQLGLQGANQEFNADQILRGNQIQNAGLLGGIGQQQQDLQNQQLQVAYQNLLQQGLSPVMINDILRQGLASVPFGTTSTASGQQTTKQSPSVMSMIGSGLGIAGSLIGLGGLGGLGGLLGGGGSAGAATAPIQGLSAPPLGSAGYGMNALNPLLYNQPNLLR